MKKQTHLLPASLVGKRLDKALAFFYPRTSLRQRRRWIGSGMVLVNGRCQAAGMKVEADQIVEVFFPPDLNSDPLPPKVRVLAEQNGLFALYKPDRLHSQKGRGASLEDFLPELIGEKAILLNRLDFLTSGIVLATKDATLHKKYLCAQERGQVKKKYLALVEGNVEHDLFCPYALDCKKRKKTRVLKKEDPSSLRHTRICPVQVFEDGKTLVIAHIIKGQRHQIRAHLAHAGFPIVGDPLYGKGSDAERLFLHHASFGWDDFFVSVAPEGWPERYRTVWLQTRVSYNV